MFSCFCVLFCFAIWGLLCFHTNFRITYSSFVKNAMAILIGISFTLQIALISMFILAILIFPVYEIGMPFHMFVSSLISFIIVLQVLSIDLLPP